MLLVISRQTCWDIPMSWLREHCLAVSNLSCLSIVIREVTSSNVHPMPLLEVRLAVQLNSRLESILKPPMCCGCMRANYLSTSHHRYIICGCFVDLHKYVYFASGKQTRTMQHPSSSTKICQSQWQVEKADYIDLMRFDKIWLYT
jgi:hypothetical protein